MNIMTHADLVKRAEKFLLNTIKCRFVLKKLVCYNATGEIPDAIGWKYDGSHMIECKTSRSDFFADKKKFFRQHRWLGIGNYRYYMTIPELVTPEEVPLKWGLLYVYSRSVKIIVKPERMHYVNIAIRELPFLCSALRRVYLQGNLHKIYEK